jgi:16S rRNA processing protein RimM
VEKQDWIVIARFGRPHGLKGLVSINSFTDPRDNVLTYLPWHVRMNNGWNPINVLHVESTHKAILAKVEGYEEREEVAALTNLEIGITSEQLPPLSNGEYYWFQLQGLTVINKEQQVLGTITEIIPTGSNDVLVVDGEKRHLIPYLMDLYVQKIDMDKGMIEVDWDADFT